MRCFFTNIRCHCNVMSHYLNDLQDFITIMTMEFNIHNKDVNIMMILLGLTKHFYQYFCCSRNISHWNNCICFYIFITKEVKVWNATSVDDTYISLTKHTCIYFSFNKPVIQILDWKVCSWSKVFVSVISMSKVKRQNLCCTEYFLSVVTDCLLFCHKHCFIPF